MYNVFSAPGTSDDKSLVYLNQIFGSVNGIIQSPEAASGATVNTIGAMFQYFNSVILAVGALIVVYITVVGVLATAHEGEFMGKKWNNIWIPIRTVFGIAALVPMGGGYSALQMIMMWVIVQGIGAANNLWNVLLVSVSNTGSMYANITLPITGTYTTFGTLFEGLVCDATARITYDDPTETDKGGYFCAGSKGSGFCGSSLNIKKSSTSLELGPSGQCGKLTFCDASKCSDANSISCVACQAQVSALNGILPTLAAIAQQFAMSDYAYRDFYVNSATGKSKNSDWSWITKYCQAQSIPENECCIPSNNSSNSKSKKKGKGACEAVKGKGKGNANFPNLNRNGLAQNASDEAVTDLYLPYALQSTVQNSDFIYSATSNYTDMITTSVNAWIIQQAMQSKSSLSSDLADAQSTGWIFAGAYYYAVSEMNNNNLKNALPEMAYKAPDISSNDMSNYRNNYMAATTLANQVANGNTSGDTSGSSSAGKGFNSNVSLSSSASLSGITSAINTSVTSIQTVVSTNLSGSSKSKASSAATPPNPLVQLQTAGMILLLVAMILFAAFLFVGVLMALFSSIDVWVAGTGMIDPASPAFFFAMFVIIPAFFALLGILITIGGLLGVYTPLIPYIVFSMGAIGWMLSVMEAMVAGPLVALGILSPSGQHELLGKAEPGLMLLFNVFLRPILMIFGLATAMLMAGVAVEMINYAFWSTVVPAIGGEWNILELIIYLGAYVFLIVTALNKCFSAIHVIPEKVIRWIGGQPESYGEAEALGEVKRGVDSTTAGVKGGTDMTSYATKSAKGAYKRKKEGGDSVQGSNKGKGGGGGGKK